MQSSVLWNTKIEDIQKTNTNILYKREDDYILNLSEWQWSYFMKYKNKLKITVYNLIFRKQISYRGKSRMIHTLNYQTFFFLLEIMYLIFFLLYVILYKKY